MVAGVGSEPIRWADEHLREGAARLTEQLGGTARRRVIFLLAAVLSLDSADKGAIGAVAPQLESSLHVSNLGLGLLVTITSLVGALATVPMGSLVDKSTRVRLLQGAILLWGAAELASSLSTSYAFLVGARVALGAVTALAGPAVASLTGDFFPPGERGRIYGFIISGELLGAGFGVLVSGLLAGWFGWRPALAILAVPSLGLALLLRRLPEPARGGQSWIAAGDESVVGAEDAARADPADHGRAEVGSGGGDDSTEVREVLEVVESQGIEADEDQVFDRPPERVGLREALGYVLKVRSNVVMIVASSLGYFFFAGLKTYALLFVRGQYSIGQSFATVLVLVIGAGALVGVLAGGRLSDRLIGRGRVTSRIDFGILGYVVAAALLAPAVLSSNLAVSLPLFVVAAAAIAGPNATLDAARLDVVPAQLWGRAEAARTVVRTLLEAFAPLIFGLVSQRARRWGVGRLRVGGERGEVPGRHPRAGPRPRGDLPPHARPPGGERDQPPLGAPELPGRRRRGGRVPAAHRQKDLRRLGGPPIRRGGDPGGCWRRAGPRRGGAPGARRRPGRGAARGPRRRRRGCRGTAPGCRR